MPDYKPLIYWIKKREELRINKITNDPILKEYRFCNVRREDDRVTIWINENIRKPFADHPLLWLMLCISRQINWPDTLSELVKSDIAWPYTDWFDPSHITLILNNRKIRQEKIYTGAYMISAPHKKGEDKQKYIAENVIGNLWKFKHEFPINSTLQKTHEWITQFNGWGPFMAYQAIVDMRFTKILNTASDIYSWAAAGPGTLRGLNRIYGRDKDCRLPQEQALIEIRETYKIIVNETEVQLDFSDIPNVYCETDKYMRTWYKEGTPRNKYVPGRGY